MSRAARSVYAFGIYLVVLGGILLGSPNTLLSLLQLPTTTEPWVHILGVPVMGLGLLFIASARAELVAFFRATVGTRVFAFVSLAALAVLAIAPPIIAAFGLADLIGALWTFAALRRTAVGAPAV
jgi:hypothetical protein